eukprot:4488941-Alexandrium_andersonii.AAC.1
MFPRAPGRAGRCPRGVAHAVCWRAESARRAVKRFGELGVGVVPVVRPIRCSALGPCAAKA